MLLLMNARVSASSRGIIPRDWHWLTADYRERSDGAAEAAPLQNRRRYPSATPMPSAEADSKAEIMGLDAGLKASSTHFRTALDFLSNL